MHKQYVTCHAGRFALAGVRGIAAESCYAHIFQRYTGKIRIRIVIYVNRCQCRSGVSDLYAEVFQNPKHRSVRACLRVCDTARRGNGWSFGNRSAGARQEAPVWTDDGDSFGFGALSRPGRAGSAQEAGSRPAARSVSGPASSGGKEILTEFAPGDRVVSRRFGAGTVEKTEKTAKETTVTILFDKFGRKVLLPEYAALTREE